MGIRQVSLVPKTSIYQTTEYSRLYKLKIWDHKFNGLRWQCLTKAHYTCKACGWVARASETHKLVAHHRVAHKGNWELFSDISNLDCVCKSCHDGHLQSFEKTGKERHAIGIDGWPLSSRVKACANSWCDR
jgi:hypothetical protein